MKALVRPPGNSFRHALSSRQPPPAIDIELAQRQHAAYCTALRQAGLTLITLPPDEAHPDACFVQDTAVIYGQLAVLARLGAKSRRGEQAAVRDALAGHRRLAEIRPPATLEGGDVLVIGSRVFVGLSARTDAGGFAQLRDLLELEGASVHALEVSEGLHLLSHCTYLGRGVLLATDAYAGLPAFAGLDVVRVPPEEVAAANALGVGEQILLPQGCPGVEALLRSRGLKPLAVDLSEFAKADGGATCLSLLF